MYNDVEVCEGGHSIGELHPAAAFLAHAQHAAHGGNVFESRYLSMNPTRDLSPTRPRASTSIGHVSTGLEIITLPNGLFNTSISFT